MRNKDLKLYILGGFVFLSSIVIIILLFFFGIPENNRDIVNVSIGTVLGMSVNVIGYFFGSSKSSAEKPNVSANEITVNQTQDGTEQK